MAKSKVKDTAIDTSAYDYKVLKVRGKDGRIRYSRGNADAVAKATLLHFADGGTIDQVIKANKLEVSTDASNVGLVRMTVGGMLRAKIKAGETVKIGSLMIKSLKQHVDLPKVEALADKPRKAAKTKVKAKKATRKAKPAEAPAAEAA